MEFHVLAARTQLFGIKFRRLRRIILVLAARDVKDGGLGRLVRTGGPVARNSAAQSDDAAHRVRTGRGEAIVQRYRLREADEESPLRGNVVLAPRGAQNVR